MDATALNYDSTANIDNGSCLFPDCNGIAYGTSLLDSCGVCQQAYIYNFSTNIPTFLNDTSGVIVGPGEALIMPNDPSNPLWNASCSVPSIFTSPKVSMTLPLKNNSMASSPFWEIELVL